MDKGFNSGKSKAVLTLVLLCILTGAYTAYQNRLNDSINYFSEALKAVKTSEIVFVKGQPYTVENGKIVNTTEKISPRRRALILRTAYAKIVAMRNPPFALPGADLDSFARGVNGLAATRRAFVDTDERWIDRMLASRTFFPVDTLKASLEAEVARRAFIRSGNEDDLALYREATSGIAPHYLRESFFFTLTFRWLAPDDIMYVSEQHRITKENSLATFGILRDAMREQSRTFSAFSDCISGLVSSCDARKLQYPVVDVFDTARVDIDPASYAAVRSFYESLAGSGAPEAEPDVLLSKGYCQNPELPPLVGFAKNRSVPIVREAADVRFLPLVEYVDVSFFKYFIDNGFSYVPSSPFSHYTCMFVPYDESAAFAVLAVGKFVAKHTLSTAVSDQGLRQTFGRFEVALSGPAPLDERDARAYVRTALADGNIAREYEADLLELALMFRYRSAGSGYFLEQVATAEANNIKNIRENVPTQVPLDQAFFTRTAFAALSLIVIPDVPPDKLYGPSSLSRDETPFRYLTDLMSEVPLADLVLLSRRYHSLH